MRDTDSNAGKKTTKRYSGYTCMLMISLCWSACFACGRQGETEVRPPNIVIIVADDMGYGDLACYGNTGIKTPHLDKLAAGGIKFLDFHSNGVVCSPTRAALLTGKYPQECGISGVITAKGHRHTGLDTLEIIIPEYLKKYGYRSGIMGKWHLGYDTAYSPLAQGFDVFKGFVSGNVDYISHYDQENHYDWWWDKRLADQPGYLTDLITSNSLEFIDKQKGQPFFLYIAHGAPHSPYQNRQSRPIRGREVFSVDGPEGLSQKKELYRQMIEILDEGVGEIMGGLERNGLLENTLVFFLSDNGASRIGSNSPFKGNKGEVWEGGHRVPAIASWQGTIRPKVSEQLVTTMDIFPTIVDLVSEGTKDLPAVSGRSFSKLLKGEEPDESARPVFWGTRKDAAVREGNWKLVKTSDQYFLYDLSEDPSESRDLSGENPDKVRNMVELLKQWQASFADIPMRS